MSWLEQIPLASHTTLEVGGPARFLAPCADESALIAALAAARARRLATLMLGGGSNMVVADTGFDGVVLTLGDERVTSDEQDHGRALVRAGAGTGWDDLVARVTAAGLGGLECLSGIPGRVGAAPIQNIGAYGQEVSQTIDAVHAVERDTGLRHTFENQACGFGYRTSRFKVADAGRWIVVQVDFRLQRTECGTVAYRDLKQRFEGARCPPTPADVRRAVLEIRREKSMVIRPNDPNRRSAGSFFVNPVVDGAQAVEVATRAGAVGKAMPAFPTADDRVKLSAGWLIEAAGFSRGYRVGAVGLSSRHALAIVNHGGATAADVLALAGRIRRGVEARFGVTLTPEPNLIGFDDDIDTLLSP